MKLSGILHKILITAVLLLTLLTLASCGKDPTPQPPAPPPNDGTLNLVADGKLICTIVRPDTGSNIVKEAASYIKSTALKQGIEAKLSNFGKNDINAYEILIGETEYFPKEAIKDIDVDRLGINGYLIKRFGAKIIIMAQNDKSLLTAVNYFTDNFLNVSANKTSIPENYQRIISSGTYAPVLKLAGSSITEYGLTAEAELTDSLSNLASMIKTKTGYTLTDSGSKKIILTTEGAQNDIITANFENGNLIIRAKTALQMKKAVVCFWYENLAYKTGEIDLSADLNYSRNLSETVFYSDFNVTQSNDQCCFNEMLAAHDYANSNGYKVFADYNAKYYISTPRKTISIKTDVEWGNAEITIDDSGITSANDGRSWVFTVKSGNYSTSISVSNIKNTPDENGNIITKDTTKLLFDPPLTQTSIVTFYDNTKKQYIREGANANSGQNKKDTVVVYPDGTIDTNAPFMWDFDYISSISVLPIDEDRLTVNGGVFTTIANQTGTGNYYTRGIRILRSNTVVDSLKHYVVGEGTISDPYEGFFNINNTAYVTLQNCIFTGRKYYGLGGTYDFSIGNSISVSLVNCSQTNDIANKNYWGIMGGNYIKNIVYDSCAFSRFDAHSGIANATIKNSIIGHNGVSIVGYGTLLIEDSIFLSDRIVQLRNDYGASWDGDIIIKNARVSPVNLSTVNIILGSTARYHDFGYTCYMPTNVIIDGLVIDNARSVYVFSNYDSNCLSADDDPPYVKTQNISIKNSTHEPIICPNPYLLPDVNYTYE